MNTHRTLNQKPMSDDMIDIRHESSQSSVALFHVNTQSHHLEVINITRDG